MEWRDFASFGTMIPAWPAQGNNLEPPRDGALRFSLLVPETRQSFGPLTLDPIALALGAPLEYLLARVMAGPKQWRRLPTGALLQVFPLALPAGQGIGLNLGQWAEAGFFNDAGVLRLTVPALIENVVGQRIASYLVRAPEIALSSSGGSRVVHFWLRLEPSLRVGIPLGEFGEVGVEVG